eukprot:scaffold9862_cov118-Isochrysis_galbana.AAC.10
MASRAACAPGATLRTSIGSRPGKRSSARQSCTSAASMAPAGTTSCSSNLRPGPKSAQAADEAPPDSILIAMASDMAYCGYSGREWAGRAPGKARSQRVDPAMSARKSRCSNRWKGSASGSSEKMSRPNSSAVRWQPQRVDDCICRKSARRKGRLHSCDQRRRAVPPRRRERICGWKADSHTCSALAMHSEANSCCPVCPQIEWSNGENTLQCVWVSGGRSHLHLHLQLAICPRHREDKTGGLAAAAHLNLAHRGRGARRWAIGRAFQFHPQTPADGRPGVARRAEEPAPDEARPASPARRAILGSATTLLEPVGRRQLAHRVLAEAGRQLIGTIQVPRINLPYVHALERRSWLGSRRRR